jgi:hypothetical protein
MDEPAGHELRLWVFMDFGDAADVTRWLWQWIEALSRPAMKVDNGVFCLTQRREVGRYRHDQHRSDSACSSGGATVRRRKRCCFDAKSELVVPGHDAIIRVDWGARGCVGRSKISMMIMRPPQHGHGSRRSSGVTDATVSGVGGTASSSRARPTFTLRPALASRP